MFKVFYFEELQILSGRKKKKSTEQIQRENSHIGIYTCTSNRGKCHPWGMHGDKVNKLLLHRGQGDINADQMRV